MKDSYNQKRKKYYYLKIYNVNIYLNKNEKKFEINLPKLYTKSQKIEHLINFYITHNKDDKKINKYILCYHIKKGNIFYKNYLCNYIIKTDINNVKINSLWNWEYLIKTYDENNLIILKK